MKSFEYGDSEIGFKEILIVIPSVILAIMVLTLPRIIADTTNSIDGWISILISGLISMVCVFLMAKLSALFPKQTFFEYTSKITAKPFAYLLTTMLAINLILLTAYEVRIIGEISKEYLFVETPIEVLSLIFFLVVIYGAANSRVAIFRVNLMFIPIILVVFLFLQFLNVKHFEFGNIRPFFNTSPETILQGVGDSIWAFSGFEVLLFYLAMMNRPKDAPKAVAIGMTIPIFLYILSYAITLGVFGIEGTKNLLYPTIELAKGVELPGEFFERFESLFFVIWIMAIYTTTVMALDVTVMSLKALLKKFKKVTYILVLAPIIFILAYIPENVYEVFSYAEILNYFVIPLAYVIPPLFLIIAKLRGISNA